MGRAVHLVSAEGSVESLGRDCALPDAEVTLPASPSSLKGQNLGRVFSHEVSARMARCPAFMPYFRGPA